MMRAPLALVAASVLAAALAAGCADMAPVSAFAGKGPVVAYSGGGGVMATAIDLGNRMRAGDALRIDGDCLSACTLALMDVVAPAVCWTDRTRFLFHAAHVNGRKNDGATARFAAALPAAIQSKLPPPAEWSVTRWYEIDGRTAKAALGRGDCGGIG